MRRSFHHRQYAADNPDLAAGYGEDDDVRLSDHFFRHGMTEMRGVNPADYLRLEAALSCASGHVLLVGWADRRIVQRFVVSVEVGYMRYDFDDVDVCWFHRPDVNAVTGDDTSPSGFVAFVRVPEPVLHARFIVFINDRPMVQEGAARFQSVGRFLNQALGACAVLADQPIGTTLGHAKTLYGPLSEVWQEALKAMTFTRAFSARPEKPVERTIVITVHRKAAMLLMQLEALAPYLVQNPVEVVVVGNDLQGAALLVEQLHAFCQIHDISLSLHLCSGNAGFSAGNNHGAAVARGETLIFMNPDVFPPEHAEDEAFAFLSGDPGEALHGALLYYGAGLLMHSGMYATSDLVVDALTGKSARALRVEHFGKGLSHHVSEEGLEGVMDATLGQPVLASAALWKVRKSVYEALGGLPTDYLVAYYEDADFCLRLLESGREIEIDTTSRWIHMEGVGKPKPPHVRTFMWLNRALFSRRFANSPYVVDTAADLTLL